MAHSKRDMNTKCCQTARSRMRPWTAYRRRPSSVESSQQIVIACCGQSIRKSNCVLEVTTRRGQVNPVKRRGKHHAYLYQSDCQFREELGWPDGRRIRRHVGPDYRGLTAITTLGTNANNTFTTIGTKLGSASS